MTNVFVFYRSVLESSGTPGPGFLYGNNYWLGSRTQCHDTMNKDSLQIKEEDLINNTRYRDPQKEFPPFKVHYFAAYIRHNSTLQYHLNIFTEVSSEMLTMKKLKIKHLKHHIILKIN